MKRNIIKYASLAGLLLTYTYRGKRQLGKSFSFNWKLLSLAQRLGISSSLLLTAAQSSGVRPCVAFTVILWRHVFVSCFGLTRTPDDTWAHKMQNQQATKPKPTRDPSQTLKSTSTNQRSVALSDIGLTTAGYAGLSTQRFPADFFAL